MHFHSAYINVLAITMIFAAAAGALVTIGTVIANVIRKAKKAVNDTLGIDENRNKEVEADLDESFGETASQDSAKN